MERKVIQNFLEQMSSLSKFSLKIFSGIPSKCTFWLIPLIVWSALLHQRCGSFTKCSTIAFSVIFENLRIFSKQSARLRWRLSRQTLSPSKWKFPGTKKTFANFLYLYMVVVMTDYYIKTRYSWNFCQF